MTHDRTGDGGAADVDPADVAPDDAADPAVAQQPRVKICGHTTEADVRASAAAGADAVGVIADVSVDTPREVDVERATELLAAVPPLATGVLVAMPDDVAQAVELVGRTSPDAIQVHGTLSPAELAELGERVHVDVVAAVGADVVAAGDTDAVAADVDDPDLAAYAEAADALLVDTPAADGGGGTGRTHDWERTREAVADLDVPVVLAGGLDPENVADAVATVAPFGVDVASGVERDGVRASEASPGSGDERSESAGGVKDRDAVAAFVRNAQSVAVDGSAGTDADDGAADSDAASDRESTDEPAATEGSR